MNKITATIALAASTQAVGLMNGYMEPVLGWDPHADFFEESSIEDLGVEVTNALNAGLAAQGEFDESVNSSLAALREAHINSSGAHTTAMAAFDTIYWNEKGTIDPAIEINYAVEE